MNKNKIGDKMKLLRIAKWIVSIDKGIE